MDLTTFAVKREVESFKCRSLKRTYTPFYIDFTVKVHAKADKNAALDVAPLPLHCVSLGKEKQNKSSPDH